MGSLKELPVDLYYKDVKIKDDKIIKLISKYLSGNTGYEEKIIEELDLLYFESCINDFSGNGIEFYFQNKKEIDSNHSKKELFLKKFKYTREKFKALVSKEKYPESFYDENLRSYILEEQSYRCLLCGKTVDHSGHMHHIDYNKQNMDASNLVFLCPRCHGKTNYHRHLWQEMLTEAKKDQQEFKIAVGN
jgi:predicted restriction endonuclease